MIQERLKQESELEITPWNDSKKNVGCKPWSSSLVPPYVSLYFSPT